MALIIVLLDYFWDTMYIMFLSQILLFLVALIISYLNFKKRKNARGFTHFYLIAIAIILLAWVLNFFASLLLNWNIAALIYIYILNIIFFLLFLFGVTKITSR